MSEHKTFFGKLFAGDFGGVWQDIKNYIKDLWESANHNVIDASITITDLAKNALENAAINTLALLTPTQTDDEVLAFMKANLVKILTSEFFIKEITPDSTSEEIQAVLQKVLDQYGILKDEDKQQLFTSIAANLYRLYLDVKQGKKVTFGSAAILVETGFKMS